MTGEYAGLEMADAQEEMVSPLFLSGGGEMGARIRAFDWSSTSLGEPTAWPQSLRSALSICLSNPLVSAVHWGPELRILYNDAYIPALAKKHPWALGRPFAEVWSEIWDVLSPQIDAVMTTGVGFSTEQQYLRLERRGHAEDTWWIYSFAPIRGEDGLVVGIMVTALETTGNVLAERGLQALNDTLEQRVADRTQERDRIWQLNSDLLGVADEQGIWLSVNPTWTKVLGWEANEIVGRTSEWMEHPDDREKTRAEVGKLAAGGTTFEFQNRFRSKTGDYRTLDWTAVPAEGRLYCTARDVTDRLAAANALKTSQSRQRVVFDLTRQLMGIMDLDGTLLEANPASLDAIGSELSAVVGQPFWTTPWFSRTSGMDEVVQNAIAAARDGQSLRTELPLVLPNGETRIYDFGMHPVRDADGRVVEIMPEASDITELRRAEEALRQSQKMEAVGQLTGGLAHDFNNLLAGISGSLELMQARIAQGRLADVDRYLVAAQGASKRAAALTHRLLAFSRRQTLDPKPTAINALIIGMEDMIRRTVGPSVNLESVSGGGVWNVLVDPNQLENALLNLCINARDAMPDGGRITIETANRWLDERAGRERDLPPGQYVSMCVSDNGTGMSPDVIAKAFDPFFTTKPIGLGTGLGLSMIYGFARQSGGQVRIYSEVAQGTMICVYLPRHIGDTDTDFVPPAAELMEKAKAGQTVLVVDDEPLVRMLVVDVLEEQGYTPIEVGDGPSALKVLRSNARIDLLITDVGLPNGMNGRQVADAARELRPGLKVLFVTGYAENAVLNHGHLDPGMQVVTKPFDMNALARRIQSMLTE